MTGTAPPEIAYAVGGVVAVAYTLALWRGMVWLAESGRTRQPISRPTTPARNDLVIDGEEVS